MAPQDQDTPDEERGRRDYPEVGKKLPVEEHVDPPAGVEGVVQREGDTGGDHKEGDDDLHGE
jgi:hypothetical protein